MFTVDDPNAVDRQAVVPPDSVGEGGRFKILERLGSGGFGTVFRAFDNRHGAHVAIKMLRGRSPTQLLGFKQEFRGLAEISHENLVRIYELSSDDWFVVMELVEGVNLREALSSTSTLDDARIETRSDDMAADNREVPRPRDATADDPHWAGTLDPGIAVANIGFKRQAPSSVTIDAEKVRRIFAQLARGIVTLHQANRLHRDIKPSNVMITAAERVVLLDFGLLATADGGQATSLPRAGTPGFMPPEQRGGKPQGPASDWYAFGATLYDILCGQPPLGDDPGQDEFPPEAPEDLVTLCRRLLASDPVARPTGTQVLEALRGTTATLDHPRQPATTQLVGREAELRALDGASDDADTACSCVFVVGAAGLGKSALVDAWLRRREEAQPRLWGLRSRCFEKEYMPYKALDGIVDALVGQLLREPERAPPQPPADIEILSTMFPVVGTLSELGTAWQHLQGDARSDVVTSRAAELRDRAVDALIALVGHCAREERVICVIDDAQWGDGDSAMVLARLARAGLQRLILVLTHRPDPAPDSLPVVLTRLAGRSDEGYRTRVIELAALDDDDSTALVRSLLPDHDHIADARVARVVRESAGSPFFLRQLTWEISASVDDATRQEQTDLASVVARQLARTPESVRRFVEVLSIAARPIREEIALRAATIDPSEVHAVVQIAERGKLIVGGRTGGQACFETLHARVRDEVVRALEADTARTHHRSLAASMRALGENEPEALLPHLLGAGASDEASACARDALCNAERSFAFERAAELCALVLTLAPPIDEVPLLHARKGEALANGGRSAAAAAAFDAARTALTAAAPSEDRAARERRRLELARRSAELWLRSGYVSRGSELFREVLSAHRVELPTSERAAQLSSVWRRARFVLWSKRARPMKVADVPRATLDRLDALWSATTSFGLLRPLMADAIGLQHLLEAERAGEPTRLLKALAFEASFEAVVGGSFFNRRCDEMIAEMDALADARDAAYLRSWVTMGRGVISWFRGQWDTAWASCESAAESFASQGRGFVWELSVCDVYGLSAASYLGRVRDLARIVPKRLQSARERGDLFATTNLAFYQSFLQLTQNDPDGAIATASDALEPFRALDRLANQYGIGYAVVQGHLYRGDAAEAWDHVRREWPSWAQTGMTKVQCARVEARYLRARSALARLRGAANAREAKELHRALDEDLRALTTDGLAIAAPMASAVRSTLALRRGKGPDAISHMREAQAGFARAGMRIHAGAAAYHLAACTQRAEDIEAAEAAIREVQAEGVARPRALFDLTVVGE